MRPSWRRNSLIYIAILLAGIALIVFLMPTASKPVEVPLSEVVAIVTKRGDRDDSGGG